MNLACGYCYKEMGVLEKHLYECKFGHGETNEFEIERGLSETSENFRINPLACPLCGKSFTLKSNLKQHTRDLFQEIRKTFPNLLTFDDIIVSIRKSPENFKAYKCPMKKIAVKKCQFCSKTFDSFPKLRDHENSHTGNKPFDCPFCHKRFGRICILKKHTKDVCQQIKTTFPNLHTFEDIVTSIKESPGKFKDFKCSTMKTSVKMCQFCPRTFTEASTLRDHENRHRGIKPYDCPLCGKRFTFKSNMKNHTKDLFQEIRKSFPNLVLFEDIEVSIRKYPGKFKDFKCPIKKISVKKCQFCSKTFQSISKLRDHENSHTGNKPFGCPLCHKRFARMDNLKRHTKYVCQKIKTSFPKFLRLEKIVSSIKDPPKKIKSFECPAVESVKKCQSCLETFASSSTLRDHENSNRGIKPYACSLCGKRFTYLCKFQLHTKDVFQEIRTTFPNLLTFEEISAFIKKSPDQVKGFECSTKKTFVKRCQFCSKRFNSSLKLRDHENSHTGNRPYGCPLCDVRFTQTCAFKRHTKEVFQEIKTSFPNLVTSEEIVISIEESPEKFKGFKCARALKISANISVPKLPKLRNHENCHTKEITNNLSL